MKKELFAIPIFEDRIDLDRINLIDVEFEYTWDSNTLSTFGTQTPESIPQDTWEYLSEVIDRNLGQMMGANPRFGRVWKNVYNKHDYQDVHIHPKSQWSFVIYVDRCSKTSFLNPSIKDIQNQLGNEMVQFPLDYKPNLEAGSIIIFPSFLFHMVNSGEEGTTISGNIYMDY